MTTTVCSVTSAAVTQAARSETDDKIKLLAVFISKKERLKFGLKSSMSGS
jgi:hypothetical protein